MTALILRPADTGHLVRLARSSAAAKKTLGLSTEVNLIEDMNFLLRATSSTHSELPSIRESSKDTNTTQFERVTLEGLISEDLNSKSPSSEDSERENNDVGSFNGANGELDVKSQISVGIHSDVTPDEGWILVPHMELHDDWITAPDIDSLRSLDRSFVFPGEKIHILACLAASKQDAEVITPFKVAAVICKNDALSENTNQQDCKATEYTDKKTEDNSLGHVLPKMVEDNATKRISKSISMTESLIRMEDKKQKVEELLQRLKNSHFFVRISESHEPLWSKRNVTEKGGGELWKNSSVDSVSNAIIDQARFDGSSGGMARNSIKCCSLSNGDIVVLLEVNVGTDNLRDPVLEILQFERFHANNLSSEESQTARDHGDPSGELLSWLLPLDRALPPPRPLSPMNAGASVSPSHRPTLSASSGSQLFSFGHFRSYSMPSMPQTSITPSDAASSTSKSNFNAEDINQLIKDRPIKNQSIENEGFLSFRGVPLEPGRYTVQCGLGGMYLPGKRWRRKLEIIQPIEIQTFTSDCNTEDFLCVQIKNVSPSHIPDLVIYVDSISIVFEEAPKDGRPVSLPISCIEAGNGHRLPNLTLRREEQHSFILKVAMSTFKDPKGSDGKFSQRPQLQVRTSGSDTPNANKFAVLVSCRCNYTESKLFFKQPTSWKPRVSKSLLISVASEISDQTFGSHMKITQLPVQTLTLQASNLTTEDATLTVLAPASSTAPPSVISLNSDPTSPSSPFAAFPEIMGITSEIKRPFSMQRLSSTPAQEMRKENKDGGGRSISLNDRTSTVSDVVTNRELGCTHLWLQSSVPLGCIPAQSSTTVKLELLPLTDGIITLDSLQINIKEKGVTYIPEHPLKIHATSSIATGIM